MSNDFDDDVDNFEADEYELGSRDLTVVKAAIQLLNKIILAPFVSPAEIVSVSKVMHVLKRLPHTSSEMNVSITLTGPRRSFHGQEEKHEIYHWWEVEIEETLITITSRGYFHRRSTGGDSFIVMDWKGAPGCETDHADFLDRLGLVDDAQPFEQEVMQIDLSEPGYKLTVNDDENPLLEEIAEDEESDLFESSLDEDEDEDVGFDAAMSDTVDVDVEKVTRGEVAGSGLPITPELLRATGNIVVGEIRLGAKRFSVLIKKLRAEFDDTIVNHLKPTLIAMWNANQKKYGLDEATSVGFDAAMTTVVDVEKVTRAESQAAGIPVSQDLAKGVAKRTLGAIKLGVKQFDAYIKTLRVDFDESAVKSLKPQFISVWNMFKDKCGLDEATSAGFDEAMSNTVDLEIEQAIEAATSATTVTCKQCGTQNRVGEVPLGRKAVCCSCRSVLGSIESPCPPKRSAKLSVAWAWIAMLGIGLVAWIAVSSHSGKSKESTNSSALQSQPSTSDSPDYSSSSSRQIPPTPWKPAFTEPEQALPPHGKITWYSNGDPIAPLEIRSSRGSHYVVKLSDYYSKRAVLSVFVLGGSTIDLDVPLGTYRITYASGDRWYGPTHLFGPETAYFKADSSFDFRVTGNQISGYTLTLYKVVDGNLQTTPISPNEF